MKIEHLALWVRDLEATKEFYVRHFGARAGARYDNPAKGFSSYFLSFAEGARLELMHMPGIAAARCAAPAQSLGYIHMALSVGSREAVDALTASLRAQGHPVLDGPRRTGDGYYESVVLDPEGNRIEITV